MLMCRRLDRSCWPSLRTVQHRIGHRRHHAHVGRPVLLNQRKYPRRLETPHHHLLGPHHGRSLRAPPAVGVKQRNRMQIYHRRQIFKQRSHRQRVQIERAVRQHHSLRRARAPARVEQFRRRHLVEAEYVGVLGHAFLQQLLISKVRRRNFFIDRDVALDRVAGGLQFLHQRREVVLENQDPRAGMVQDRHQLLRRQPHVQRHHDPPRLDHAVIAFQQLVVVETQIRHPVARLHALFHQR